MAEAETIATRMQRIEQQLIARPARPGDDTPAATLAERMAYYGVPGVSIALIENGEIAQVQGYGVRDAEMRAPVMRSTLFQAASISKPVAVLGALRLVERGLLDLDADVNDALRSWQVPPNSNWQPRVTLRQLASHSAGVTVHGFPGYRRDAPQPTLRQVLDGASPANTAPVRVDTIPGTQFRYAGGGTSIIQQLLLDVTGTSFPDLLRELVLEPLGMHDSGYLQPLPVHLHDRAATGHRVGGGPVTGKWHVYPEMAAAGLWTTPSDLARFAIALQRAWAGEPGGILSQPLAREMLTPQIASDGRMGGLNALGLGPFLGGEGALARFGHSGGNEGFTCHLLAYRAGGRGAVVMTNADDGGNLLTELFDAIARECDWPGYLPELPARIALAPEMLERYAGVYALRSGFTLTVQRDGDALSVQPTGQPPLRFAPESATTFAAESVATKLAFESDNSTVARVRFQQNGREMDLTPCPPSREEGGTLL
jgi:CubicO group peptidase (beta-lactamase class C family)